MVLKWETMLRWNVCLFMKYVSVHVSSVYTSSACELMKPLNVSKPVCSSNATKPNVCNTSSSSELIKLLKVSKPVSSSNATKCKVCNTNSLSHLVKPLNASKPVSFNNATEHNVSKVVLANSSNY